MNKRAQSLVEISMIALFVAISAVAIWGLFGKNTQTLVKLNKSTQTEAGLKQSIIRDINALDPNKSDYIQKRIETCGALGKLIAQYNAAMSAIAAGTASAETEASIAALRDFISAQLKSLDSDADTDSCISSPPSCKSLMTASAFNWSLGNNSSSVSSSSTYTGGKIPVTLNYTYSYVNSSGDIVEATAVQNAFVQKEQNAAYKNTVYSSFLPQYMDKTFGASAFTGAVDDVQARVNSYMTGTNCVLSKSSSEGVDFINH